MPDDLNTAAGELGHIRGILEAQLLQERDDLLQIVFGPFRRRELVLADGPGPRSKRLIVPRDGQGGQVTINTTITLVLSENEGRLGGLIVNSHASNNVRLLFCHAGDVGGVGNAPSNQAANRPSAVLVPGGSFDFRMGNALYGGPVVAYGVVGASLLDVAEF